MNPMKRIERAIRTAQKDMVAGIASAMYIGLAEIGPRPEWRTHVTHPSEWELDGGGPGQYWIPRPFSKSWIQEQTRRGT